MENIAIIEFTNSHQECLNSQILFLKDNYRVFLVCTKKTRNIISGILPEENIFTFEIEQDFWMKELKRFLKDNDIKKVIFNTATGKEVLRLTWTSLFSRIKFYGTIHNIYKLNNSGTQKLINMRIKKYFVLADYLKEQVGESIKKRISVYYPIYFQNEKRIDVDKKDDEFWIAIPGEISFRRRNYESLIKELETTSLNPRIKFIILGKKEVKGEYYQKMKEVLDKKCLNDRFKFFDGFIPNDVYYSYLNKSSLILPLIKTDVTTRRFNYTKHQVSGSFGLSYGFNIPMVIEPFFEQYEPFKTTCIFYENGNLIKKLNELAENNKEIEEKKEAISKYEKFDFAIQQSNYLKAIE